MRPQQTKTIPIIIALILLLAGKTLAQDASVKARIDATQISVGDQVRLFLEATHNDKQSRLQWATIPDTFNSLEVVEKGRIDTTRHGDIVTYRQQVMVTGFDSGSFRIPPVTFTVIPASGAAYALQSDSFQILVQTVPVDTTQPFKGIKGIIAVKSTWLDYIWVIIGALVLIVLAGVAIAYFIRNKRTQIPVAAPKAPQETIQEKALRLLNELEQQQLWQAGRIKEYYVQLTDILRNYIEERFRTPALELTTDELLQKARNHPGMNVYYDQLANVLYTADLAKFAKAQPLPQEHTQAMDLTRKFIVQTKQESTDTTTQQQP